MINKKTIFILVCLFLFCSVPASDSFIIGSEGPYGHIPQPILKEPVSDKVDLNGKRELLFRWSSHEGDISQRKWYDFRLYEGYQMVESNLILQQNVLPNKYEITVNSDIFKLNQVYTWSVRQTYRVGKSQRSTSSFTVISK
jgi:hypothetical protein